MDKKYSVRRLSLSDAVNVVQLLNLVFKPTQLFTEEWWTWKYLKNPFGFWGEKGDIWVAESGGKIIGHYAIIPCNVKIGNEIAIAGQSVDTAVHPEYRRIGVFETLARKVYDDVRDRYSFLFGYPSDMAYQGFLKLGWTEYPVNELLKFNNYDRPIKSMLSNSLSAWTGKVFLKTLNAAKCFSSIRNLHRTVKGDDVIMERIDKFGDEFNTFWKTKRNDETVIVERTVPYLNWRFASPFGDYQIWVGRSQVDRRILGYSVFRRTHQGKIKNVLSIVDLCALSKEEKFVQAAIDLSLKEANVDLIRIRVPAWNTNAKALSRKGFIEVSRFLKRAGVYQPQLILYDFERRNKVPTTNEWFYSLADTDYA
jgi:GNAT superfamily N-acetyltransferase